MYHNIYVYILSISKKYMMVRDTNICNVKIVDVIYILEMPLEASE